MVEYTASGRDDYGAKFQDGAIDARGDVSYAGSLLAVLDRCGVGSRAMHHFGKGARSTVAGGSRGLRQNALV